MAAAKPSHPTDKQHNRAMTNCSDDIVDNLAPQRQAATDDILRGGVQVHPGAICSRSSRRRTPARGCSSRHTALAHRHDSNAKRGSNAASRSSNLGCATRPCNRWHSSAKPPHQRGNHPEQSRRSTCALAAADSVTGLTFARMHRMTWPSGAPRIRLALQPSSKFASYATRQAYTT